MSQNKIIEAAQFADMAHAGQRRKYNDRPYITHPARVAGRVAVSPGATEAEVVAAWLHDVVEYCGIQIGVIQERFGAAVSHLVWELTNPSKGSSAPRAERNAFDRKHISESSMVARRIKLIDRCDNLMEMEGCGDHFLFTYLRESRELLECLRCTDHVLESELQAMLLATEAAVVTEYRPQSRAN